MSKIVSKIYKFNGSTSPDVRYFIYYKKTDGAPFDYLSHTRSPVAPEVGSDGGLSLDLAVEFSAVDEGSYDLAITAVDAAGNESDFGAVVLDVALDFTAPDAPTGGEVVNV